MNSLVPLPVAIPLAVAAVLAAFSKHGPRRLADACAIGATVATGGISIYLRLQVSAQPIVYWFGAWTPRSGVALGISFVVDPISASLSAFVSVLVLAAFVFSLRYFDSVGALFHVLMLGFLGAMCGFSLSGDLFNLFVFFELMSASAFALCGYKNEEPSSQQGALNFAITNTVGAFLVLFGIAMLYSRTGALNMAQIGRALSSQSDALVVAAFVLIMCGFFVKAAVLPFHFWLADAHAVAPTPVCILFSGVMVELGVYAVARVYWAIMAGPFAAHQSALRGLLLVVGSLTSIVAAIMCFGQRHIKRLLAFSTVSHVGVLVIAFALLAPKALGGAAIYTLGHGLVKSALFICAGMLLHRFGTVDEIELAGRAQRMRWSSVIFLVAGLGLTGVLPFSTFIGETTIEGAAKALHQDWVWMVFFFTGALTGGAVFRVLGRVFFGWGKGPDRAVSGARKIDENRETSGPPSSPATMFVPAAVFAIAAIGLGFIPGLRHQAEASARIMTDTGAYQARVLDHAYIPYVSTAPPEPLLIHEVLRSLVRGAFAISLAAFALSSWWPHKKRASKPFRVGIGWLRSLHSGHVGDYVAFLTFGVAVFGLVLELLIHRFGM